MTMGRAIRMIRKAFPCSTIRAVKQAYNLGFMPWRIAKDRGITEQDVLAIVRGDVDANNYANYGQ